MHFNEVVIENLKLWILYGFPTVPKADGIFDWNWPVIKMRLSAILVLFGILLKDLSIIVKSRAQNFKKRF